METKKITEQSTRIFKGRDGWEGKTIRTEKGQTFDIHTFKTYGGNLITSVYKVNASEGGNFQVISFSPMEDNFLRINHGKVRATEKAVKEAHYKGLAAFDVKIQETPAEEVKAPEPQRGDIIFLDGYGKGKGSEGNKHIIYDIKETEWGTNYLCIEADTLELSQQDHIRPYSERFGIGNYFEPGYNMESEGITEDDLCNMLIEAQDVKKAADEARRQAEEKKAAEAAKRAEYLSQFKKADVRTTTNLIKKHCTENFNISKISVKTDIFSGGSSMDVVYHSPEKIEDLERWINNFQYGYFNGMEDIYEYNQDREDIIIFGHILQTYKYVFVKWEKGEGKPEKPVIEPVNVEGVKVLDYSAKAVAVIGDTKPIKDQLKAMGGRFNFRLYCGPGWIFKAEMKDELNKLFS